MKVRTYLVTVSVIFGLVGLLHLLRAVSSWSLLVDNYGIPVWLSWTAFVVLAYLSYSGFRLARKS